MSSSPGAVASMSSFLICLRSNHSTRLPHLVAILARRAAEMLLDETAEEGLVGEFQFCAYFLDGEIGAAKTLGYHVGRVAVDHLQRGLSARLADEGGEILGGDDC